MGLVRLFVILLATSAINSAWCHHHHHGVHADGKKKRDQVDYAKGYDANAVSTLEAEKNRRSLNVEEAKENVPFSARRLEKMLEKAILKIITGDLSTADMLLLKSLNYSLEEVLAIRERELIKKKDEELRRKESMKSLSNLLYGETDEKKHRYLEKNSMDHFSKSPDFESTKHQGKKNRHTEKSSYKDFDYDAYNRQAVLDYENLPSSNAEFQQPWSEDTVLEYEDTEKTTKEDQSVNNVRRNFDKAMEPHVVFKIRYDDSEFDSSSGSDETNKSRSKISKYHVPSSSRHVTSKNSGNSFHTSPSSAATPVSVPVPVVYQLSNSNNVKASYSKSHVYLGTTAFTTSGTTTTTETLKPDESAVTEQKTNDIVETTSSNEEMMVKNEEKSSGNKGNSEYEGLEWVEDDVYRVIPEFLDSMGYQSNEENETSDYTDSGRDWNTEDNENDTLEYQNDTPDSLKQLVARSNISVISLPFANLSSYQQAAIAHRREGNVTSSFDSQGEKAIEDIKSRILVLTGRSNSTSNTNQVQREKLTMFSPTCQIPRNTDQDSWTDPFTMNMHFQLNLTSGDHVVAAKLRIYKLPQENLTSSAAAIFEEEEEDEKKIRISVYYYTKSLKKHRSKKRLMDSVVTPLSSEGTHLALDVRQGLRFWRLNSRNPHGNGNNHGLVIQVEDQDGRPLKPALYIQQPSCGDQDSEQKAYQRVPALFVQACARYVRIVNGERVTYVNCRH